MGKNVKENIDLTNIYLMLFGNYLVTILGTAVGIGEILVVPVRVLMMLFYLSALAYNLLFIKNKSWKQPINIFWILYLIRAFYDIFIVQIYTIKDPAWLAHVVLPLFLIFIPMLNIQLSSTNIVEKLYKYVFPTLFLLLLISLPFSFQSVEMFRRSTGGLGLKTMEYGQLGVSLIIISYYRLWNKKFSIRILIFSIAGILTGLLVMGVAASKSPFVSLAFVFVVFTLAKLSLKRYFIFILVTGLVIYSANYYLLFLTDVGSVIGDRINLFVDHGDYGRMALFKNAIREFIENPVFGNQIVIESGFGAGVYPHNLILESFMAMGIFGGLLFLFIIYKPLRYGYTSIHNLEKNSWVVLLFIQYLSYSMFSNGLYSSVLFWAFLSLVFKLAKINPSNLLHQ